tara:strand:- start:488 stop:847 length:360 start_codon:yes stop_codon:yes gene_type:complete
MVVAGHWNFIIVRCLAPTYLIMAAVTIYKVESNDSDYKEGANEISRAFDNLRMAVKFYNRQKKRLVHKDVDWQDLRLEKLTFYGTPRQIACRAFGSINGDNTSIMSDTETLEITERNKL